MIEPNIISSIFQVYKAPKMLAEILGIIESLEVTINKLTNLDFDSAVETLEKAKTSDTQQESLIQQARGYFSRATNLEKEERLVCAYLGEAFCHYFLNDLSNTKRTLIKLAEADIDILKQITPSYEDFLTWINPFVDNDNTFFTARLYSWRINMHTKSFSQKININLKEKIKKINLFLEKNESFNPREYVLLNRQQIIWQMQNEAWECAQKL